MNCQTIARTLNSAASAISHGRHATAQKKLAAVPFRDGDEITIEAKRYFIAKLENGRFTLIPASDFVPSDALD